MNPDNIAGQLANGQVLVGRYRVEGLIGRGGMAEVYGGFDERLARPVALKVLRESFQPDHGVRKRFAEEARAAAMFSHPNVVAVYDAGEDWGRAFIVMELVSGETLAAYIAQSRLSEPFVRRTGGEVLDALAAAHARGLLHRDIKPANVVFSEEGVAKVADFGIAKALDRSPDSDESTAASLVLGTPGYLAPERAQGDAATVRSDLWSVGVLLYESLTARKPFEGATPLAVALAAIQGRYVPVEERRPDVDPNLAAVIERALQANPEQRFSSADEMARYVRDAYVRPDWLEATAPASDPDTTRLLGPEPRKMVFTESGVAAVSLPAAGAAAAAGDLVGTSTSRYGEGVRYPVAAGRRRPRSRAGPVVLVVAVLALIAGGVALLLSGGGNHPPSPGSATTKSSLPTTTAPPTTAATTSSVPSTTASTTTSTTTTTTMPVTTTTTTTTMPSTTTTTSSSTTATSSTTGMSSSMAVSSSGG
ncbi:MAG: serine/threonine-protein kinase [Acidimicrobiales bacterium]